MVPIRLLSGYPYGASYSPLIFAEADWETDLRRLQEASMNVLRIGDVHGSWDRIEPRPGEYRFDALGRFYAAAAQHGIHILIATGASSPPLWLARQHPDVSILSSRGERYPLGASYHWACIHHPAFQAASEDYLRALAGFAAAQPNHFGWQISNEIGFPFMPARDKNDLGLYCYCEHSQRAFHDWLRQKYLHLEALTEAWSWSTTNFVYNSWDEASPPESMPESWSGVTRWMDWRLFWQEAFARFAGQQHQVIRSIDATAPTSVNTFNFKGFDRFGTFMGLDQWQIARQVDHIGYDLYPGSGDKLKMRPEHNSMFLDHGKSVAASVGRDFWIHELESGPIGGWLMGPEHDTDEADVVNGVLECLGHHAKMILFMPWREWGYQPLHWGALVELDGSPTPRLPAAAHLGAFIQANHAFLAAANASPGEVAILESKPNAIFLRGTGQEEVLFAVQRAAYRAFWDRGFDVDFITPELLTPERMARYRVICLPLTGLMDRDTARRLRDYAAQGGLLVGFARCAALDERGWYQHPLPVDALGEAFGLSRVRQGLLEEQRIDYRGVTYHGWLNRDYLTPLPGTEQLAVFTDGYPAATLAHVGQGAGLYIATQPDPATAGTLQSFTGALLDVVLQQAGIAPKISVHSPTGRARGIDPHLLETNDRTLLLMSNYAVEETQATLTFEAGARIPAAVREVFPAPIPLKWAQSGSTICLTITFQAKEGKGIEIIWQ